MPLSIHQPASLQALATQGSCACGATHHSTLHTIVIEPQAERALEGCFQAHGMSSILLVADLNTWSVAGARIETALKGRIDLDICVLETHALVADDAAVRALTAHLEAMPLPPAAILSLGSGTLNDLCREVSTHAQIPYAVFATANSMDGYASSSSPLIKGKMKITYPGQVPFAIFADPAILRDAPADMTAAGIGDTLGKHTCLMDWELAELVYGEARCPAVYSLVRDSVDRLPEVIQGLRTDPLEAHRELFDSLLIVGIAMSFHGNSRPASGAEHHLSHFWEMQLLLHDRPAMHHGTKVALGGRYTNRLYHQLSRLEIDFDDARRQAQALDRSAMTSTLRRVYGEAAEDVLRMSDEAGHFDTEARLQRIDRIEAVWPQIQALARRAIAPSDYVDLLRAADLPTLPSQTPLPLDWVRDALLYAWHLRDRSTILSLLFDLGVLSEQVDQALASIGL